MAFKRWINTYGSNIGETNDWLVQGSEGADYAYLLVVTNPITIDVTLCSMDTDYDTKLEIFTADHECNETTTWYYIDDDGTCTYAQENFDCDNNCTADVDCAGECGGSAVEDDCGECNGDGSTCACDYNGDANGDGNLNVTDIVLVVVFIINGTTTDDLACSSDVNMDGVVNVTDIVQMVSTIING